MGFKTKAIRGNHASFMTIQKTSFENHSNTIQKPQKSGHE